MHIKLSMNIVSLANHWRSDEWLPTVSLLVTIPHRHPSVCHLWLSGTNFFTRTRKQRWLNGYFFLPLLYCTSICRQGAFIKVQSLETMGRSSRLGPHAERMLKYMYILVYNTNWGSHVTWPCFSVKCRLAAGQYWCVCVINHEILDELDLSLQMS